MEFTRQRTARIPRQREQYMQRPRVERLEQSVGVSQMSLEGQAWGGWALSFSASAPFSSSPHNIPLQ